MFGFKPIYRTLEVPTLTFDYDSLDAVGSDMKHVSKICQQAKSDFRFSGPGMDDLRELLVAYFAGVVKEFGDQSLIAAWMTGGSVAALEADHKTYDASRSEFHFYAAATMSGVFAVREGGRPEVFGSEWYRFACQSGYFVRRCGQSGLEELASSLTA